MGHLGVVKALAIPDLREAAPSVGASEDEEMVAGVRRGDAAAMQALYARYAPSLLRHLRALSGDDEVARDLLQEVFLRVWTCIDDFRAQGSIAAWLHGIARNLTRRHTQRAARRARLLRGRQPPASSDHSTPQAELEADEARRRLYVALDGLAIEQREAFVMRVIEQRPLEECAELLGAPVSTISYRARRAEEHLRRRLAEGERT